MAEITTLDIVLLSVTLSVLAVVVLAYCALIGVAIKRGAVKGWVPGGSKWLP